MEVQRVLMDFSNQKHNAPDLISGGKYLRSQVPRHMSAKNVQNPAQLIWWRVRGGEFPGTGESGPASCSLSWDGDKSSQSS